MATISENIHKLRNPDCDFPKCDTCAWDNELADQLESLSSEGKIMREALEIIVWANTVTRERVRQKYGVENSNQFLMDLAKNAVSGKQRKDD